MLKESLQYSAIDSLAKITVDIVSFSRVERYRDFLKDPEFFPQETVPYLICTFLNYLSEHIPNRKDSSSMNQVLVTAFNPFGGDSINPSAEVLRALPDSIGTCHLIRQILPVSYSRAASTAIRIIQEQHPCAVVCLGQASGRSAVTPEFIGINWMDAKIQDSDGILATGEKIIPNGPDAIFSSLPVALIASQIREAGIPSSVSYSAGTYVCNYVLYSILYNLQVREEILPAGFIHLPNLDLQKNPDVPYLSLSDEIKAVRTALRAVVS